jgi:hypothetical protein
MEMSKEASYIYYSFLYYLNTYTSDIIEQYM